MLAFSRTPTNTLYLRSKKQQHRATELCPEKTVLSQGHQKSHSWPVPTLCLGTSSWRSQAIFSGLSGVSQPLNAHVRHSPQTWYDSHSSCGATVAEGRGNPGLKQKRATRNQGRLALQPALSSRGPPQFSLPTDAHKRS